MLALSIIMLTRNSGKYLKQTLPALAKALKEFENYELLIMDGDSKDDTIPLVKKYFPEAKVFNTGNLSLTSATRMGIKNSVGKYVAFIDSDIMVPEDWFKEMLRLIEQSEDIGGAAGIFPFPETDNKVIAKTYRSRIKKEDLGETFEVPYTATSNLLVKGDLIRKVGPRLQEHSTFGGQDQEVGLCIREEGYKMLINPKVKCIHMRPARLRDELKRMWEFGKYRYANISKHKEILRRSGMYPKALLIPLAYVVSTIFFPLLLIPLIVKFRRHRQKIYAFIDLLLSIFYSFGVIKGLLNGVIKKQERVAVC